MPPRHYKKRKRNLKKFVINDILQSTPGNKLTITTIQQYFFDIIDSIILYSDINNSIKEIKSLINLISSTEEVFVLLDKIENTIESIVTNLGDGVSIGIIHQRITYVRTLLSTLPANYNNYSEITSLILDILDSVTGSIDFNTVYSNIIYIQQVVKSDDDDSIQVIHNTILSIITNIGNGESNFIINERINYLQTLIKKLA
jgi:hypothetical protein